MDLVAAFVSRVFPDPITDDEKAMRRKLHDSVTQRFPGLLNRTDHGPVN